MSASLVGSEMCIRDSLHTHVAWSDRAPVGTYTLVPWRSVQHLIAQGVRIPRLGPSDGTHGTCTMHARCMHYSHTHVGLLLLEAGSKSHAHSKRVGRQAGVGPWSPTGGPDRACMMEMGWGCWPKAGEIFFGFFCAPQARKFFEWGRRRKKIGVGFLHKQRCT